ncbi:MAG: alpha-2-macroglobulin [Chloroflexota bacterium]|nr:alpha-2-macroglobulin [Chloroflexota bacterium]
MRQAAVALLAVPIVFAIYLGAALRRSTLVRVSLTVGVAVALGIGLTGTARPTPTVARPPTPILPLTQAAFTTTFSINRGLTDPVSIRFNAPMDPASVAAAVTVEPATPVSLTWDATGTLLTVVPKDHWAVGAFHTVTVRAGALAMSGQPLTRPARVSFVTREATTDSAMATAVVGGRVALTTNFVVTFARPVDPATVATGIRLDPPTLGTVEPGPSLDGVARYLFVPAVPLQPDTAYRLFVSGVRDTDGAPLDTIVLGVRTGAGPAVIRFRPTTSTTSVARDATISVRFTQPMDRRSTARAFAVSIAGAAVTGKVSWAERDTVLIFTPNAPFPSSATVAMDVAVGARNTAGIPLAAAAHGTFQTVAAKVASAARTPSASGSTGGSAVGGGSWGAVEVYYLGLMNCTRTGGWVTSTGACSSPGGRNVAPLKLSSGISSKVSRPYAKRLAVSGACSHFIGGNPGDRLRSAGYTSYRWAENLGCRSGGARAAVLGSHLFFQSEKSYGGGHYVNMMNAAYNEVGIGVWVSGGRVRLVVDFYHP